MCSSDLPLPLRVNERTVRKWRNENTGPPVLWAGGVARYKWSEVQVWLRRREHPGGPEQPAP